jgi:mono/diheme cytochrome c family protein
MHRHRLCLFALFALILLFATGFSRAQSTSSDAANSPGAGVTAVQGESWLVHLNRSFNDTSMGKTGHIGPAAGASAEPFPLASVSSQEGSKRTVRVRGADLYRLNCQGCHGESGTGAPPEINSVIDPVRNTSPALVKANLQRGGMKVSDSDAVKLAAGAKAGLLQRLHEGGDEMPAFSQLNDAEIRSLLAYLQQLAGVPGAENQQIAVTESPARIGELVVKSTCHTCHGATGADPDPQQLLEGAIPPLSTLISRVGEVGIVRKVTKGAPLWMGSPALLCRGRMPVFYYLGEEEAADVYLYLSLYPPADGPAVNAIASVQSSSAISGRRPDDASPGGTGGPEQRVIPAAADRGLATGTERASSADLQVAAFRLSEVFIALLIACGLAVTLLEFKRLSHRGASQAKDRAASEPHRDHELEEVLR